MRWPPRAANILRDPGFGLGRAFCPNMQAKTPWNSKVTCLTISPFPARLCARPDNSGEGLSERVRNIRLED